jgi:hypothetical protein
MFRRKRTFLETLRRWKQIDGEFEASLGYTGRTCFKTTKTTAKPKSNKQHKPKTTTTQHCWKYLTGKLRGF